ncbi:hypothetical protein URH17368_2614 [Alicyclobacillus hesperidum URH17-3-68]|uniref:DUF1641 domain-containing protein n=1 Tax=Alicyclobacillus hesperidum TaxID=89784 RepID=UPI000281C3C6|nr:DUF1641 domain-containing protein [Alicyclobacillus hesperidum]EJY54772.1 hypothetical protein URH17368_2614 [Alicyclobacillus hesperidum URH17-3-68]GLG00215.1 hypothetical protein Alches_02540 [Alicyclobacillus hesperidum subsp. aegles]
MANAITSIVRQPVDDAALAKQKIEQALVDHADGVIDGLALLQACEERGLLPLLRALLEQGDDVLRIVLNLVSRPEITGGLKNGIGALQFLGAIPPESMSRLFEAASTGFKEATGVPVNARMGVYDALKALRDPDVGRALAVALAFLKGMGRGLADSPEATAARGEDRGPEV